MPLILKWAGEDNSSSLQPPVSSRSPLEMAFLFPCYCMSSDQLSRYAEISIGEGNSVGGPPLFKVAIQPTRVLNKITELEEEPESQALVHSTKALSYRLTPLW